MSCLFDSENDSLSDVSSISEISDWSDSSIDESVSDLKAVADKKTPNTLKQTPRGSLSGMGKDQVSNGEKWSNGEKSSALEKSHSLAKVGSGAPVHNPGKIVGVDACDDQEICCVFCYSNRRNVLNPSCGCGPVLCVDCAPKYTSNNCPLCNHPVTNWLVIAIQPLPKATPPPAPAQSTKNPSPPQSTKTPSPSQSN